MFWPNYPNLFFLCWKPQSSYSEEKMWKTVRLFNNFYRAASQVCDSSMGERKGRINTGVDGWENIESRGDTPRTEFRRCLPCRPAAWPCRSSSVFLSVHFLIFKLPLVVSVSQGRVRIKRDVNKKYLLCSRFLINLYSRPPFLCLESDLFVSFPWLSSDKAKILHLL